MAKLTDSQLVLLSAAAQRESGAVYPIPKTLKLNKAALATVLKSLLARKLVTERPAVSGEDIWRKAEDSNLSLAITDDGVAALDGQDQQSRRKAPAAKPASVAATKAARAPRALEKIGKTPQPQSPAGETKLARLISLLSRKNGATIPEAMELTGWQAHSVRGAMSGALKKKRGLTIVAEATATRGRVYRIAASA